MEEIFAKKGMGINIDLGVILKMYDNFLKALLSFNTVVFP